MSTEVISLWPSNVRTPDANYGDEMNRVRSFLYTKEDGTTRFVVIDTQGLIIARTDVESYTYNGAGVELQTPSGEWVVIPIAGCSTCGGGSSQATSFELLRGQGEV